MGNIDSKWRKSDCTRIIEENKDMTNWFNGEIKQWQMWHMFRDQMGFGDAETAVMLAALIKVGAKFR